MPNSRPEQVFDEEGVCDACRTADRKHHEIDWAIRRKEFEGILDRYRNKNGDWWDCVIPVSGGKDSCFQAYTMKYEFGMNPLCVNFVPCEMTEIGLKNILFLRDLGFDMVQVAANRKTYRKMVRKGFFDLGDCCWPEHIGIFTAPVRVAVQYKIPLIIWGENSQFEYGGPASKRDNNYLDRNWLEQFQMLGYRISDLYEEGFDRKDLLTFEYPSSQELKDVGVTGLFLGYYLKWQAFDHVKQMIDLGWNPNPDGRPVEGAYTPYENLDCKWIAGLHDYMKFLKFGYGRATDQLCIEIRHGRIERETAIRIVRNYEGQVPRKYLSDFLSFADCTEKEFFDTLDRFINRKIFITDGNGNFVRDQNGDVTKVDYGY
jgi:N-acetyl sugar amidotransferase